MNYSRYATAEELIENLTKININTDIKKSGIPMMYDEENFYIKDDGNHSIIIGSANSGKTQVTILPPLRLAIKSQESFIVHDVDGSIYNTLKDDLDNNNYKTIVINFANPNDSLNSFNPFVLPYELYKNDKKDLAIEVLEKIGYYFCTSERKSSDPFWEKSAISLFIGLALHLFENNNIENINLNNMLKLLLDLEELEKYINTLEKDSPIYMYLSNIILAPAETRGSIIAVFKQYINVYTTRESLSKLMSNTDFNIFDIQKEKVALFIISENKEVYRRLIPLLIDECYQAVFIENNINRRLNILIDEFDSLIEIKDLINMLNIGRSHNIRFNIYIKSFLGLINTYGKELTELLKIAFGNIIYLLANDIDTLQEISKLCGNKQVGDKTEPLITIEELKVLDQFEAIILIQRMNPIRTKLIPDYKIEWK